MKSHWPLKGESIGTIERILPSMEYLLSHYKAALDTFVDNKFMLSALDTRYDKSIKYFNKNERNPAHIAAMVLQPNRKWAMFGRWEPEDLASAKQALRTMWQFKYNTLGPELAQILSEQTSKSDYALFFSFLHFCMQPRAMTTMNK